MTGTDVCLVEHLVPLFVLVGLLAQVLLQSGQILTEVDHRFDDKLGALLNHFHSFQVARVENLHVPEDVADAWWSDTMVVVKAIK